MQNPTFIPPGIPRPGDRNGEVVMTTGATQPEIHVDVWSGNHPFFTGTQKILDTEGRVDRS